MRTSPEVLAERRRIRQRAKYHRLVDGHRHIKVRVTLEEYDALRRHAQRYGHSIPEHLRTLVEWDMEENGRG